MQTCQYCAFTYEDDIDACPRCTLQRSEQAKETPIISVGSGTAKAAPQQTMCQWPGCHLVVYIGKPIGGSPPKLCRWHRWWQTERDLRRDKGVAVDLESEKACFIEWFMKQPPECDREGRYVARTIDNAVQKFVQLYALPEGNSDKSAESLENLTTTQKYATYCNLRSKGMDWWVNKLREVDPETIAQFDFRYNSEHSQPST